MEQIGRCGLPIEWHDNPTANLLRDRLRSASEEPYYMVHLITHGVASPVSQGLWAAGAGASCDPFSSREWVDLRSWLSECISNGASHTNLLVFLDVCYSGNAARFDFVDEGRRKVYVFAATEPGQLAFQARFTRAVTRIFQRLANGDDFGAHATNPFISLGLIRNALAAELDSICKSDRAIIVQRLVTSRHELLHEHTHPAFPNPSYGRFGTERGFVELAKKEPALADSADPVLGGGHFLLRASGAGSSQATSGIHFVGREEELHRLVDWLDCDKPDGCLRIVTGSPGMGKSALLGVVVCLAHPILEPFTYRVEQRFVTRPYRRTLGQFAAVHARNRDLRELVLSLSRQLNPDQPVDRPDDLVAILRSLPAPPVVVIDALDEATDPEGVHLRLLQRLITERKPGGHGVCRLLVGTRDESRFATLFVHATASAVLNLDTFDPDTLRNNIVDYVVSLLREHAPHWTGSRIPSAFAEAVADKVIPLPGDGIDVGPYLLAQLHTYRAASQSVPMSPGAAARLGGAAPQSVEEAFAVEFEAKGDDPEDAWVKPILTAFAFAEGTGMPLGHARSIAQEFNDSPLPDCSDVRLRDVLTSRARFYLRTDVDDDGSALYALFHRSLQQHLRGSVPDGVEASFAALRQSLGYGTGKPDWRNRSTPYIRRHFGQHAIAAIAYDRVVTDPSYLAYAEHTNIVRDLRHARSPGARSAAAIYRESIAHHAVSAPQQRLERIALDSARLGNSELNSEVTTVSESPGVTRWTTRVAMDDRAPLLDQLDEDSASKAVACAEVNGHQIAVTGGSDGAIKTWDLATGAMLMREQRAGAVEAIACTTVGDRPIAITGSDKGELLVWDLTRPEAPFLGTLQGCNTAVRSISCRNEDGMPIAITASDGESILMWDLRNFDMSPMGDAGHAKGVRAVAFGDLLAESIVVSGNKDGQVHVWELFGGRKGLRKLEKLTEHKSAIRAIACRSDDLDDYVISGDEAGTVISWEALPPSEKSWNSYWFKGYTARNWLRARRLYSAGSAVRAIVCGPRAKDPFLIIHEDGTARIWWLGAKARSDRRRIDDGGAIAAAACCTLDDASVAVTVSERGTRLWGLTTPSARHTRRSSGGGPIHAVVSGTLFGEPFLVTGSDDGAVRLWSVRSSDEPVLAKTTAPNRGAVRRLALSRRNGRPVAVSISSRTARLWDLGDATARHPKHYLREFPNLRGSMHAVACGSVGERPVAIIGGSRGVVRVWDIGDPEQLVWQDLPGHEAPVQAIASVTINGQCVAVSGASDGSMKVWYLGPRTESLSMTLPDHATGVETVACTNAGGDPLFVTGFRDGSVKVWKLGRRGPGSEQFEPNMLLGHFSRHAGAVTAAACGTLDGAPVAVTGGTDNIVRVWMLPDGELLGEHEFPSDISSIAITRGALAVCYRPDLAVLNYRGLDQATEEDMKGS
ncbi:AAA family ATPase [Mycobacterium sp. 852002-51613_SCH5001154]|uniref:AAA family ATPase n=1 Tax=Mycobacterium sp. 852002-51613_SCH5001154 TaxID=1834104 RepID=UPI000A670C66|nr:AAA family ATPase [Mycobacterium sp. 852002-51613_SCH5001154]